MRNINSVFYLLLFGLIGCTQSQKSIPANQLFTLPTLVVLGTVQDAGSPHIGCQKNCCAALFNSPQPHRKVVALGLVDPVHQKTFLIEATPDIASQLKQLNSYLGQNQKQTADGILLTHAHIGHYSGLMYLGREALNASVQKVFVMPKMKQFIETNGPWSQLVKLNNISLQSLQNNVSVKLSEAFSVIPLQVPHRDEFSETVGFIISGPNKKALFIPDIDKWAKWQMDIKQVIAKVDYAFIDGTFYDAVEINNRNIAEIPHPFVSESMDLFNGLPDTQKQKIYFIHFNHTNPLLNTNSKQSKQVIDNGFNVARIHQQCEL